MKKMFALLALALSVNAVAGNIDAGKAAVQKYQCASCHGDDFSNPKVAGSPKLAGQHADYLEHALVAYQRGTKGGNGRVNATMGAIAQPLSRTEIQDIAAYLSSLKGSLVVRK